MELGAQKLQMTQGEMTQYLWDTYQPGNIWIVLCVIGITTAMALFLYDRFIMKKGKMINRE